MSTYQVTYQVHDRHPLLWCLQHVVHRLETEPLRLLGLPEFVTDCSIVTYLIDNQSM